MKLIAATALAALLACPALARTCGPRENVISQLNESYGETRRNIGIARQGAVMETFANSETGSWTITITLPDGLTCLVVSGQAYESLDEKLADGDPV